MVVWPKFDDEKVEGEDDLKSGVVPVGDVRTLADDSPPSSLPPEGPGSHPSTPPAHQRAALVRQALMRGHRKPETVRPPTTVVTPVGLAVLAPPRAPKSPKTEE